MSKLPEFLGLKSHFVAIESCKWDRGSNRYPGGTSYSNGWSK